MTPAADRAKPAGRRPHGRAALCFAALLILSGCAALTPAPPPEGPSPDSLRARAVVELSNGVATRGRAVILASRPDRFRIEVFGPLGQSAALMVSDGETLAVYSDGEVRTHLWDSPFFPYSFTAEEVVALLTGDRAVWGEDGPYRVSTGAGGGAVEIVKLREGPTPAMRASMGSWREVDGAVVPGVVEIYEGTQALRITYRDVEISPNLPEGAFEAASP